MSEKSNNGKKNPILIFKGKECCYFNESPKTRSKLKYRLELVKRYDETQKYTNVYNSLWQCKECGAFFLLQEIERIDWSTGDDTWTDDYYQVESPEHADKLVSESDSLLLVYDGPKAFG